MSNGRLERETKVFDGIEKDLKKMPKVYMDYYYTLRAEKKSYSTIYEYIKSIKKFVDSIDASGETFYKNITTMDINKYMISLESRQIGKKMKPTSSSFRAHQWYALNSFFEFLVDTDKIEKNPVPPKSRPKLTDNVSVEHLTEEEVSGIIKNIEDNSPKNIKNRDLCIFTLGITTGLRVSAILQMNVEDVDLDNNVIHVVEKRNKSFNVIIGKNTKKYLKNWIADRKKYFNEADTNALFISMKNNRISYDVVQNMLNKYSKGITKKKVTPHVMRHTCATILYEKTGDIYLTSAQLHHSNISTTQRYANMSNKKLKQAASILGNMLD